MRRAVFVLLALATLTPWVSAPMALLAGVVLGLTLGNPFAAQSKTVQTFLLQACVVGLGAQMNLRTVWEVGSHGVLQTALGISATLGLTWVLARALKTDATTSLLIGVGTAICGGSAIAAVAPVVGAKAPQTSMALAIVFLLNAVALFVFPFVGHALQLNEVAFGTWSALAIHDTSSVVGATMQYGDEALRVGTTLKLTRALWIIPLTLAVGRWWPRPADAGEGKAKRPWFILGFVVMAAVMTFVPALEPAGVAIATVARKLLVLTLFLVGAGVSRESLRALGPKSVLLGVVLWLVAATGSLLLIR